MRRKIIKKQCGPKTYSKEWYRSIHPYKSMLEFRLSKVLTECEYESVKIEYYIPHVYNPDFSFPDKPWMVIEAKARFINGAAEARKYREAAKQNRDKEIVFIFENINVKPYTGLKKRSDGTVMTIAEWAAKNNFLFFSEKEIPKWFISGDFDRDRLIQEKMKQKERYVK